MPLQRHLAVLVCVLQEMRQQMLRDIKILSDAQDVLGLLSFLGAYLVPDREQVGLPAGRTRSCTPVLSKDRQKNVVVYEACQRVCPPSVNP